MSYILKGSQIIPNTLCYALNRHNINLNFLSDSDCIISIASCRHSSKLSDLLELRSCLYYIITQCMAAFVCSFRFVCMRQKTFSKFCRIG